MSFGFSSYFPASHCCFACVSFHIPVLPFSSLTSFNFPYFPFCPAFALPKSCWACPLLVSPPAYFSTFPYFFLLPHFLQFSYFPFCPALPLTKSCWACPLQVSLLAYFLLFPFTLPYRTFLYCGLYLFCVCIVFFFSFFYCDFPAKCIWNSICFFIDLALFYLMLWYNLLWIWYIICVCLHFCHNLAWSFKGVIRH